MIKLEVQCKTPEGWTSEVLIFRDPERARLAKEIIEKDLGRFSSYLVVNMSASPLMDGDEEYQITVATYEKLYKLADDIEFLTPDP